MKEVILRIPEKKFAFFMELIKHLGFEAEEIDEIPEEHKTIVRERIKSANPEHMIAWKDARKQLKFKNNS